MNHRKTAFFAGSFDPVTIGHLNMFERTVQLFDELVIGIGINMQKSYMFSAEQRIDMLKIATSHLNNCRIISYEGLTTEAMALEGATVLVRGIRNAQDLAYEQPIETVNRSLLPGIEVLYLMAPPSLMHISSSIAREMIRYHAPLDQVVPSTIIPLIMQNSI